MSPVNPDYFGTLSINIVEPCRWVETTPMGDHYKCPCCGYKSGSEPERWEPPLDGDEPFVLAPGGEPMCFRCYWWQKEASDDQACEGS